MNTSITKSRLKELVKEESNKLLLFDIIFVHLKIHTFCKYGINASSNNAFDFPYTEIGLVLFSINSK